MRKGEEKIREVKRREGKVATILVGNRGGMYSFKK